jgi:hypothetical protein
LRPIKLIAFSYILLLVFSLQTVSAQLIIKNYEVVLKDNATVYMYAGIKASVRLTDIPYDTDYIQVVAINSPETPKAKIIGHRNIEVSKGASNIADFVIELEEVNHRMPYVKSLELKIKCFSKINGDYEIAHKMSMYIRPIICAGQDDEVCAIVRTKCHSGNPNCKEREIEQTFKSKCEADSYDANILHSGACARD